jgi:CRISPR-associated protein (TIGR03986 family)
MITAPFNFVPLSEKVFFPSWADDVSHDIPFEDGESGVIDITLTAKSPIFIRDHEKPEEFCQHNGEYYIPSTSIKGMVRSVLEIMSFSKMNQFNDDTYAVRDLSSAKNFYMTTMQAEKILCGWLQKIEDGYIIENCGKPGRISHREIDKAYDISFAKHFQQEGFEKTSEFKYNILGETHKEIRVGEMYRSQTNPKYDKREFYRYSPNGTKGTLVLTGQPTPRKNTGKMGDGKGYEFVFFNPTETLNLKKEIMEKFLFAYFDKRTTEPKESPDWTFWKKKLQNGEKVPVFFQKNGDQIAHFGLSYLYKLPYKHSVKDGLHQEHFSKRLDLAQTMFGYVDKKESLKGRVQFSHFKAIDKVQELKERKEVLGTPRASYYPIYVQQKGKLFTTFMDEFSIAGWKRYPIHKGATTSKTEDTGNDNVGTTFRPLKEGVVFEGKVRYHNLKKAELGALLSALTFHNTKQCFHNIGMAKSLGYGKIELKIDNINDLEKYLKTFELEMNSNIASWAKSEQVKELMTMATEQNNEKNSRLKYMSLENFAKNKTGNKDYLRSYSALENIVTTEINSLISQKDLEELKQVLAQKEKEKQLQIEEEKEHKRFEEELNKVKNSQNIQQLDNFITKYPQYENLDELYSLKQELQSKEQSNKHQKLNGEAKKAWDGIHDPKYIKSIQKSLQSFIKKWEKKNKGSEYILELIEKAKQELK